MGHTGWDNELVDQQNSQTVGQKGSYSVGSVLEIQWITGPVGQYGEHSGLSEGGGDSDTTAIVKYSMSMALWGNAVPMHVRFSPEPGFWVSFKDVTCRLFLSKTTVQTR